MKNSAKSTVKSVAVDTVKIIVYPAHLVCQTAADLLNIGQAKAINMIDDTPIFQSMHDQLTWTQNQQAYVVGKGMEIRERILAQRESNRQQDIAKHQARIDKLSGVEHMDLPVANQMKKDLEKLADVVIAPTVAVPAPPVEAPFVPINKRGAKADDSALPTMTPVQAFEPAVV